MLLRVMYHNERYDFIKAARFNEFIEVGTLAMFQRSGGWVRVDIDPIRSKKTDSSYNGAERRQSQVA
jgi:hypothetical protein